MTSGLKGRHLTQAKDEVLKFLDPKKRRTRTVQRNLGVDDGIDEQIKCLKKLKASEVKDIVAEVSANTNTIIAQPIRKKTDALSWLRTHWDVAKGIVILWLEKKIEIAAERRLGAQSNRVWTRD